MIGNKIIELDSVDSTNVYADKLLDEGKTDEGTVVWAHEQFDGKGQQGNRWESESGKNLTFTVVMKPDFLDASRQFMLNKVISLGILDFVHAALYKPPHREEVGLITVSQSVVSIKWPNDIYVGDQKIGGILIEHKVMGSTLSASIAGIGININQTRFAPDIPNPVSMIHILRHEVLLKEALHAVCRSLDLRYQALREAGTAGLDLAYSHHLLGFGQWRSFITKGEVFEGNIRGVDDLGRLVMENREGSVLKFNHKEVDFRL